jgi:hypothetical protein
MLQPHLELSGAEIGTDIGGNQSSGEGARQNIRAIYMRRTVVKLERGPSRLVAAFAALADKTAGNIHAGILPAMSSRSFWRGATTGLAAQKITSQTLQSRRRELRSAKTLRESQRPRDGDQRTK